MARTKANDIVENVETTTEEVKENNLYLALTTFQFKKKIYYQDKEYNFDNVEDIEKLLNKNLISNNRNTEEK